MRATKKSEQVTENSIFEGKADNKNSKIEAGQNFLVSLIYSPECYPLFENEDPCGHIDKSMTFMHKTNKIPLYKVHKMENNLYVKMHKTVISNTTIQKNAIPKKNPLTMRSMDIF